MDYRYFELTGGRSLQAQRDVAKHVYGTLGAKAVAVFQPLLGFPLNEVLVLTTADADMQPVLSAPGVVGGVSNRLTPTLRPKDGATPAPMGVYTHNWFTVDGSIEEFVKLSGEAWPDFESHFQTKVFGLFLAEETEADRQMHQRRLLLMTGYSDLNEWQKSRAPAPTAAAAFQRRRELTRVSLARACTLIPRA